MNLLNRMMRRNPPEGSAPEPLTRERIDAGYRLYWIKIALPWDGPRRALMAEQVRSVVGAAGFEDNALERRFAIEGLDEQAHSGASLLALLDVLRALDDYDADAG